MTQRIEYKLYTLRYGQWYLMAHFLSNQMEIALYEAKRIEKNKDIKGVKIIRETRGSNTKVIERSITYKSHNLKNSEMRLPEVTDSQNKKQYTNKFERINSLTTILTRLFLVFIFGISIAAILTYSTATVLRLLRSTTYFNLQLSSLAEFDLLIITFFVTLVFSTVYTSLKFLHLSTTSKHVSDKTRKDPPAIANARPITSSQFPKRQKFNQYVNVKRDNEKSTNLTNKSITKDNHKSLKKPFVSNDAERISNDRGQVQPSSKEKYSSDQKTYDNSLKTPGLDSNQIVKIKNNHLLKFLNSILENANTDHRKLDNFNKFGINLFLAGASEILAETQKINEKNKTLILAEVVNLIGFKKSHSNTFSNKYEEYLLQDPRYMQMFQAGRNSMKTFFQDTLEASTHFQLAKTEWNEPRRKEAHTGPITVLFTDIAGSTAMTQMHGDNKAQTIIRMHNLITREALTNYFGTEIKHTGDGIMASFVKTTNSVEAAIQIQQQTATYNQTNPDFQLLLKIGLNAGEPIAEDNDLFGSMVQMSARIVDKAQGEQIFVSENVRSICSGKGIKFINRGGFEMKGFDEPPILYEVVWRENTSEN